MKTRWLAAAASISLGCAPLGAHVLWINVVPGEDGGRRVVTSIGYGNVSPGNETLMPDWGPIDLLDYDVLAPDGARTSLGLPVMRPSAKSTLGSGVVWQDAGDFGARRLSLTPRSAAGTYQLIARTPVVPVDNQLEVNYMKAAFAVDRWSAIMPVGHALEIMPLDDLHAARAGDVVRFKVLLAGKPLSPDDTQYPYVTAGNAGFGTRWMLHSELEDGIGEFRLPVGGTWRIEARYAGPADSLVEFKSHTKGRTVWFESTFAFHLQP